MGKEIIAVFLVVAATLGTVGGSLLYENYLSGERQTIELKARSPEKGNWLPGEIIVPEGQLVRIRIRNIDTVSHGFAIPDFGVGVSEVKPGEARVVTFKPDRAGTFPFMCTVWCSKDHMRMSGKLIVKREN